ncbi:MAG TPA: SusE domain-containing protein, partial [Hanamia sp.]|nr:SusE domain-containing protein [Hanamia sp.]
VTSSYANNNELYQSNAVSVAMTPYLVPVTLAPSSANPLVLQIANATANAISFNWNASPYGANTINYALQLDTAGGNFAHPQVIKYGNALTSNITVNDLNTAAIAAGVMGGSTKNVEFRIVSYVGTDYSKVLGNSNTITINLTTYVAAPANLYIVGDATPGGWANPVPTPSQRFTKIDAVSFGIILNLTAGGSYLLLPVNTNNWDVKYGGTSANGGTLLANNAVPGSNTPAPATSGLYKIVVNFQTNTYTVTPYSGMPLPTSIGINKGLWIIGDATAGGWNNNSKDAPDGIGDQQFTQISNAEYQITIPLTAGKGFLLIPEDQGLWNNKYGGSTDGTQTGGGTILFNNDVPGSNTPAPSVSGNYLIDVNFITGKYTITPH